MHQAVSLPWFRCYTTSTCDRPADQSKSPFAFRITEIVNTWLRKTSLKHNTIEIAAFALESLYTLLSAKTSSPCLDRATTDIQQKASGRHRDLHQVITEEAREDRMDRTQTPQVFHLETCTQSLATG